MMPVLTVVIALGYLLAAYMLILLPRLGRLVPGGSLDTGPYDRLITDEQVYQNQLTAQQEEFNKLNPALREKALNLVTIGEDIPGIMVQLEKIAQQDGVIPTSIDLVTEDKPLSGNRRAERVAINVVGADYDGMKRFLADLERSRRVFDVQSLVFSPSASSFSVTARAYFLDNKIVGGSAAKAPGL